MALIYGIGVNDSAVPVYSEKQVCPYYKRWKSMLERCYTDYRTSRNENYSNVKVCQEWLTFSNFKNWMEQQNWQGKELDKDWLGDGTLYSPETCLFVSPDQNKLLTDSRSTRGEYPLGVSYKERSKDMCNELKRPFRACIRSQGSYRNLGSYADPMIAHKQWQLAKWEIIFWHITNTPDIDPRLAQAMQSRLDALMGDVLGNRETSKL